LSKTGENTKLFLLKNSMKKHAFSELVINKVSKVSVISPYWPKVFNEVKTKGIEKFKTLLYLTQNTFI